MSTVFNNKVNITDTQLADNNDEIVAIGSNGEIKKTNITVDGIPNVSNLVPYTGATSNIDLGFNQLETQGLLQGRFLNASGLNPFVQLIESTGGSGKIKLNPLQTAGVLDWLLPETDGTLALTSDIPNTSDWLNVTGTSANNDIKIILGNNEDGEVRFIIDEDAQTFTFYEGNMRAEQGVSSPTVSVYNTSNISATLMSDALTANRIVQFQDKPGTIALTSDITTPTLDEVLTEGNISSNNIELTGTGDKLILSSTGTGEKRIRFETGSKDWTIGSRQYMDGLTSKNDLEFIRTDGLATDKTLILSNESVATFSKVVNSNASNVDIEASTDQVLITKGYLKNQRRHGFFDYNDTATATTPINVPSNSTFVYLTNNELGAFTNKLFPPDGVTDVYDASLNQFDFTELPLGTKVDLRLDVEITTTGANQEIEIDIELAIGGSTYDLEIVREQYKSSGTYKLTIPSWIYMGDVNTRDNPAKFKIKSDNNATVKVNGWACAIQLY